jgi:putative ABC transport system substrate-binding protein
MTRHPTLPGTRRRSLVVRALAGLPLAALALAAGQTVHAQTPGRRYRIGYLGYTAVNTPDDDRVWGGFVQRLRELGFSEGVNLIIEQRFAEGRNERYVEFAAELVRLHADLVVVGTGTAARAVMAASPSMPVVTTATPADPVRAGLVASLAHPGGQVTGMTILAGDLVPKRIELLKAGVPSVRRIAFARCPSCQQTSGVSAVQMAEQLDKQAAAAHALGMALISVEVNAAGDFDAASATVLRERCDAVLIGSDQVNTALQGRWREFAAAQRLPMMAPYRGFGALLSYGPDAVAIYRRAAEFVARILNGANPGELPMEQPTTFELVVNLRVARSIGLTIPQSLLLRADEVIQ